jgi:hypothetical protein
MILIRSDIPFFFTFSIREGSGKNERENQKVDAF